MSQCEDFVQDKWVSFQERFAAFLEGSHNQRMREFEEKFHRIRNGLSTVKAVAVERSRLTSPDYNIFQALGVQEREVYHSALLANLLDPKGKHGQGNLFLSLFLKKLSEKAEVNSEKPPVRYYFVNFLESEWDVQPEVSTGTIHIEGNDPYEGRVDIVLTCPSNNVLIGIENKIQAEDQHHQLLRYKTWMEAGFEKDQFKNKRPLIYLTLDGRRSERGDEDNVSYIPMSHKTDIRNILKASLSEIPSCRLKSIIEQYMTVLTEIEI